MSAKRSRSEDIKEECGDLMAKVCKQTDRLTNVVNVSQLILKESHSLVKEMESFRLKLSKPTIGECIDLMGQWHFQAKSISEELTKSSMAAVNIKGEKIAETWHKKLEEVDFEENPEIWSEYLEEKRTIEESSEIEKDRLRSIYYDFIQFCDDLRSAFKDHSTHDDYMAWAANAQSTCIMLIHITGHTEIPQKLEIVSGIQKNVGDFLTQFIKEGGGPGKIFDLIMGMLHTSSIAEETLRKLGEEKR
jgi:hypothetical protein